MVKLSALSLAVVFSILLNTQPAMALRYLVQDIEDDGKPDNVSTGVSQLFIDVTDPGSNQVLFTFLNNGPNLSSITQIYFEDGATPPLASISSIDDSVDGVEFSEVTDSNLGRPPGAQNILWANKSTEFRADSDPEVQPNGVNPGESLGILFNLSDTYSFADVLYELNNGDWRVAFHVQGFSDGGSDAFVISTPGDIPVPEPTTMLLLGTGLVSLTAFCRKRK